MLQHFRSLYFKEKKLSQFELSNVKKVQLYTKIKSELSIIYDQNKYAATYIFDVRRLPFTNLRVSTIACNYYKTVGYIVKRIISKMNKRTAGKKLRKNKGNRI